MIKKCLQCGKEFESETGRKRYCADCILQRKRQKSLAYAHKRRAVTEVRKPKKLVKDVAKATLHGMTYGEYMSKRKEGLI